MTGAIVVGEGTGAGNVGAVSVEPFEPPPTSVARVVSKGEGHPTGLLFGSGVLGMAIGTAIAVGIGRLGGTRRAA